jgi:hypothetical protein
VFRISIILYHQYARKDTVSRSRTKKGEISSSPSLNRKTFLVEAAGIEPAIPLDNSYFTGYSITKAKPIFFGWIVSVLPG